MDVVQTMVDGISKALFLNPSTLSGAIDIVVVKQPDGSYKSTPFHVRFGRLQLLYSSEKIVNITVNGKPVALTMKLGPAGEAFFVEQSTDENVPPHLSTSPIQSRKAGGNDKHLTTVVTGQPADNNTEMSRIDVEMKQKNDEIANLIRSEEAEPGKQIDPVNPDTVVTTPEESKRWNWTWGWGTMPQIQPNEKTDEKSKKEESTTKTNIKDTENEAPLSPDILKKDEDLKDAVITVAEPKGSRRGSILSLFQRNKPHYLSAKDGDFYANYCYEEEANPLFMSAQSISTAQGGSNDHGSDSDELSNADVFFDIDDEENYLAIDEFGTPFHGNSENEEEEEEADTKFEKTESGDELSVTDSEIGSFRTIYTPLRSTSFATKTSKSDEEPENDELFRTIYTPLRSESSGAISTQKELLSPQVDDSIDETPQFISDLQNISKQSLSVDDIKVSISAQKIFGPYSLSKEERDRLFEENIITHEQFCKQPEFLSKPEEMAIRINGNIYPWNVAYPSIMSVLLFNKPLDKSVLENLGKVEHKRQIKTKAWMSWLYPNRWRQSSYPSPTALPAFASGSSNAIRTEADSPAPMTRKPHNVDSTTAAEEKLQSTSSSQLISVAKSNSSSTSTSSTSLAKSSPSHSGPGLSEKSAALIRKEYRKSLRPNSKQIEMLNLELGANSVTFSVSTEFRGQQALSATIYLWDFDSKLVVSDIDGTITRSDVFGHVMPMLGRDWSHSGVAKLFSSIRENGYHIVYLTSRAIGQAQTTRNFINNLKQDGNIYLPKGPVFMSPDRLFSAFNREIILRKPEEFKIACLQDIKLLYSGVNPFYAGYGNRITDSVAYKAVGIPLGKIFIINPKGEITTTNKTYKKTYHNLHDLVHEMFPHTPEYRKGVSEDYNDWNYWKIPVPELVEEST